MWPRRQPLRSRSSVTGRPSASPRRFSVLENLRRAVGVERQVLDPDRLQEFGRPRRVADVDRDRHDREILAAQRRLQAVERRHLLPAGRAPRGPEVDQRHLALEGAERRRRPVGAGESEVGELCGLRAIAGTPPPRRPPAGRARPRRRLPPRHSAATAPLPCPPRVTYTAARNYRRGGDRGHADPGNPRQNSCGFRPSWRASRGTRDEDNVGRPVR